MNEEIKEILDDLGNKDCYVNDETILTFNEGKNLVDYITNLQQEIQTYKRLGFKHLCEKNKELQQENEELKEENNKFNQHIQSQGKLISALRDMKNIDYKSRLEKASNKLDSMFANGEEEKVLDDLLELDKILKGDKQ